MHALFYQVLFKNVTTKISNENDLQKENSWDFQVYNVLHSDAF